MKSALLLAKNEHLFQELVVFFRTLDLPYTELPGDSIRIYPNAEFPFTLYNRREWASTFEKFEIPEPAFKMGYQFGYMAECRSETIFCSIMGSVPYWIDVLVCDSNEVLYRPNQLDPGNISL